jgi:cholesterol transport system auxiliary component
MTWSRSLLTLGLVLGCSGCALFGKSEPLDVRYFSPTPPASGAEAPSPEQPDLRLRVGKVSAASHLDRRIVYREQGHEVGYYDALRWTEEPDEYVRRGLDELLFERMGVTQVVSGPAPTLQVELVAFEEVKAPRHLGRVVLSVSLSDGRDERFRRTFVSEKPIEGDAPEAAVAALSQALSASLDQVAHETRSQLSQEKAEIAAAREKAHQAAGASALANPPPAP